MLNSELFDMLEFLFNDQRIFFSIHVLYPVMTIFICGNSNFYFDYVIKKVCESSIQFFALYNNNRMFVNLYITLENKLSLSIFQYFETGEHFFPSFIRNVSIQNPFDLWDRCTLFHYFYLWRISGVVIIDIIEAI